MERIVQRLNSPLLKRKSLTDRSRNFGVPLKALLYKKTVLVPRIVENICNFILTYGLRTEGLFRVNGNTKAIASLKAQFDITSANDLNESDYEDIHAICGVFKLFLREIPEGLIPDAPTRQTVKIMDQLKEDKARCVLKLRNVVMNLPEENFNLLRYICQFLRDLVANEASTKMSSANLGIVFGPCLFKCGLGVHGLRQQNLSNLATTYFITYFETVFSNSQAVSNSVHQSGLLKSANSLNSLLQRRRRDLPRRSIVGTTSTEEAVSSTAAGDSRSRPITPRGDNVSPLLSPADNSSSIATHSTSSLSLSPSRKWCYSDADELDLGSHGALARELASIMTSISIPSVTKLVQPFDVTPTSTTITTKNSAPETTKENLGRDKTEPNQSPPPLVMEDLAKSLPTLVHLRHHGHLHHHFHNHRVCHGRHREYEGSGEKVSSGSSSSTTSLLEVVVPTASPGVITATTTTPKVLTESNTETTTHTLTVEEDFEPCHAYLSSSIVDDMPLTHQSIFSASDHDDAADEGENEEKDSRKREELPSTIPPTHHFPRAKFYPPQVLSYSTELSETTPYLQRGILDQLSDHDVDDVLEEFRMPPPVEPIVSLVYHSDYHISPPQPVLPPPILIANPICQSVTPQPRQILTWPRKRSIFSRLHNRRSLDVCIPLTSRQDGSLTATFSTASKVRLVEHSSSLDISLPDPVHLEVAGFLTVLQAVLEARRKECRRPDDLEKMSSDELAQEKVDLQKCLLYFEKTKGRPSDSLTKRVMKPLYDRYRCVRRMVRLASTSAVSLSRARSSCSGPQPHFTPVNTPEVMVVVEPTKAVDVSKVAEPQPSATLEFSPMPEALLVTSSSNFSHTETDHTASLTSNAPEPPSLFLNWELTLSEFIQLAKNLDPVDLTRGHAEILSVKHKLQRFLHDYEKRIQEATNHPPSKRDRDGLRGEYNRYRDCKQRLYVIDRFVEKPQTSPESLIIDAQSVGRAHRRRKVVRENAIGVSGMPQQKVSTTTTNATSMLPSRDRTSCI